MNKQRILVLCVGNSCRSQMMHGYLESMGNDLFEVRSAGIETHGLNLKAAQVMAEDGINIDHHCSTNINTLQNEEFDFVITVCDLARETCPWFPASTEMLHHNFKDPAKATGTAEEVLTEFRTVRDEIKTYAKEFLNRHQTN